VLVGVRIHYQENEATADDLVRCVVEHPLRGRDLALHQAPLVSGDHALRDAVQNAARELLAGQKLLPDRAAAGRRPRALLPVSALRGRMAERY